MASDVVVSSTTATVLDLNYSKGLGVRVGVDQHEHGGRGWWNP